MDGEWAIEVTGPRSMSVVHRGGHKWLFRFADGLQEGYLGVAWDPQGIDQPNLTVEARAVATNEARRLGWTSP